MDIDPHIANWLIEYFVRQPLEEQTLNSLIGALPLPDNNSNLQNSLLLCKLELEVSRRPLSESTLALLEQLEEIEFNRGNEASETMRRAYCEVAVDCTLRPLINEDDEVRKFKFYETVKRVWRRRIGRMEKFAEKGGLGSELLSAWKDEFDAAVWDDDVRGSVFKKFEGVHAKETVRVYLREERDKMGPSFLELLAERAQGDVDLRRILGLDGISGVAEEETPSSRVDGAANGSDASKVRHKGKIKLRDKLVGVRRLKTASANSRGAKIVDSDETTAEPSGGRNSLPQSVEVNKAREALNSSSAELRAAVKDPLPEALRVAEAICNETRQDKRQDPAENNKGEPKLFVVDVCGVVQSCGVNVNNVPRPSLMERNKSAHTYEVISSYLLYLSAHTYEWDDSIDASPEDIAFRPGIQLPSPKTINTSPLKIYQTNNVKKRRRGRRWSLQEEEALRNGVTRFGKGYWKLILDNNRDVFEGRTEVDLKDKWRNMSRSENL
ncbi:uncharacterized protein LOC130992093 isoform X2 [Salvia miltiorrhiza]|uniref:uncharacterized protein LOC130992093 isoform X2 n=1 Tax=Salvia miltiorrhiza TaxID=226208 RepID=UPI0025ACC4DB|nr:uncharacterized protein LOC130992093 isoform X2 [Salvia miltiorrhiza]XP_057772560.1 uncharacterized protein LOC130992093 isoform X2 [Salvia miltiorrhiza]XP_057772561.1 uncharacterized protein LOC130992093 isoform X2 [Salvia miltiorrhiza]XP_057772562.1 uncharacterized protein LOC130992093 isoform X2 [Salvia miltiorrhiza]